MKRENLLRRIGGFVLAALLLSSVAIVSGTTAQAQWRGRGGFRGGFGGRARLIRPIRPIRPFYGYPYGYYNQYVFSSTQAADNQGYKDGLKTGSSDARRNQSNDPQRSHYFQNAGFGNFGETYREGFLRGYSEGFGRSAS
jgi:hypothetical protein